MTKSVTRVALGIVFVLAARSQGVSFEEFRALVVTRRTWASSLPLAIQIPLLLLVGDLLAYWSHRLFHGSWLWPFHAVHHSSTAVDWLSSMRLHPVNDIVTRLLQVVPLYWMGFSGAALAGFVPFLTFYTLVLHANVTWTYQSTPLRHCRPASIAGITRPSLKDSTRTSPACSRSSTSSSARSTCRPDASPNISGSSAPRCPRGFLRRWPIRLEGDRHRISAIREGV